MPRTFLPLQICFALWLFVITFLLLRNRTVETTPLERSVRSPSRLGVFLRAHWQKFAERTRRPSVPKVTSLERIELSLSRLEALSRASLSLPHLEPVLQRHLEALRPSSPLALSSELDHLQAELAFTERRLSKRLDQGLLELAKNIALHLHQGLFTKTPQPWGLLLYGTLPGGRFFHTSHSGTSKPGTCEVGQLAITQALEPGAVLLTWGPVLLQLVRCNDDVLLQRPAPSLRIGRALALGQKLVFQTVVTGALLPVEPLPASLAASPSTPHSNSAPSKPSVDLPPS